MLTRENEGSKKSVRKVVQDFVHQQYHWDIVDPQANLLNVEGWTSTSIDEVLFNTRDVREAARRSPALTTRGQGLIFLGAKTAQSRGSLIDE